MKTLFIDCGAQLEKVFRKVHRTDDPPATVKRNTCQAGGLPRLLDGYEVCIDDHSYMPTAQIAQCKSLRHIVFCGTGASSYMDVPALVGLGVTVHTYRGYGDTAVAEHTIALMFACARDIALSYRKVLGGVWGPLEGMQLLGKTLGVIVLGGIGRERARIRAGIGSRSSTTSRCRPMRPSAPRRRPRTCCGARLTSCARCRAIRRCKTGLALALFKPSGGLDALNLFAFLSGVRFV